MLMKSFNKLLVGLSFFACTSLFAAPLVVNVGGIQSVGEMGDSENTFLSFNVGANSTITSISYSIGLSTYDESYLSEFGLLFTDSSGFEGVAFNPGFGDDFSGSATYTGFADLVDLGLNFQVGSDGLLVLEFYEDYDDIPGADGQWDFGTITFGVQLADAPDVPEVPDLPGEVPEPASALLIGAGLAMMGYGRRRAIAKAGKRAIR